MKAVKCPRCEKTKVFMEVGESAPADCWDCHEKLWELFGWERSKAFRIEAAECRESARLMIESSLVQLRHANNLELSASQHCGCGL